MSRTEAKTPALDAVRAIAAHAGLRLEFSADVMAEVEVLVADPGIDDPALVDLTHLPFITIDYARSKDLDQALHVAHEGAGYCVSYALADAAHFVRPGTALFAEAALRGSSFYLPGLTLPMLPAELSEGIVSLNEDVDRRALVFQMSVGADGAITETKMVRARVRSRRKLTYHGVQMYIDDPEGSELAGHDFTETLDLLAEVGRLRIADAEERDVVRYDRVAVQLGLATPTAERLTVEAEGRNDVQAWNEQISLMTNMEGALFLTSRVDAATGFAGVFRLHPPPEREALDALEASIRELVDELAIDEDWLWRRREPDNESLGDYVARLPDEGDEARLSRALQRQAMLINRPSYFATEPGEHYGIGASAYSRFSSPMREMVGVVTKHMAFCQLAELPVSTVGLSRKQIEQAVTTGNYAKRLQKKITRAANKLAIDQLFLYELDLERADRPIRLATVMGVGEHKLYLQLDDPPIEVKLYLRNQSKLLGCEIVLANRFELKAGDASIRVGDAVRVCVDHYDDDRDRWVLGMLLPTTSLGG